jgi:hypothetical protein
MNPAQTPVTLIGHGMNDYIPFCAAEIQELYKGTKDLAEQGTPPEIPAALPIGQLIRMARTVVEYRNRSIALVDALKREPQDAEEVMKTLMMLSGLIDLPTPAPVKSRLLVP